MQDDLTPGPPPTPTPSGAPVGQIIITSDTTVAQGQTFYFNQYFGFIVQGDPYGANPSLTNSGVIVIVSADPTAFGATGGGAFGGSTITNTTSGAVYVEAQAGNACGYAVAGAGPNLLNQGLMQVVSLTANAQGVQSSDDGIQFDNASAATLTVWAANQAVGVDMAQEGGRFTNAGEIDVTGTSAVGAMVGLSFTNSGTIEAHSLDPTKASIGIDVVGESGPNYTNSGTISGDYSFFVDPTGGSSPPTVPNIDLINSGTMLGAIMLGQGVNEIDNTGTITGDIHFGNSQGTYNGASGHLTGAVYLGHATNTVTLGSDNGVVYGGGGSDMITGGARSRAKRPSSPTSAAGLCQKPSASPCDTPRQRTCCRPRLATPSRRPTN